MTSLKKLKDDARGASLVEYLLLTGAIAIGLVLAASALQSGYADAFKSRSNSAMGVE